MKSEKGFAHALVLLILLGGLAAGVYLVNNGGKLNFFSRASTSIPAPISGPIELREFTFNLTLPGINNTKTPNRAGRTMMIQVYNTADKMLVQKTVDLRYLPSGNFKGSVVLSGIPVGKYNIHSKLKGYLSHVNWGVVFDSSPNIPSLSLKPLAGDMDFNQDDVINTTDVAFYNKCHDKSVKEITDCLTADFNDDGAINNYDYAIWSGNYGKKGPTVSENGSSADTSLIMAEVDSVTNEIYNLQVKGRVETQTNTGGPIYTSNTIFEIDGSLINGFSELSGYSKGYDIKGSETLVFSYSQNGYPKFTSAPVKLAYNDCYDLYSAKVKDPTKYLATFCYKVHLVVPNSKNRSFYSYHANHSFVADYIGKKPTTVLTLSTAYLKDKPLGSNGVSPRVSYWTIDARNSSILDFTNVNYNIQGSAIGDNTRQWQEWCQIGGPVDNPFPQKQIHFTGIVKPEGGSYYEVDGAGTGGCSFSYKSSNLKIGFLSLAKTGWNVETRKISLP